MAKSNRTGYVFALAIWTAMCHRSKHSINQARIDVLLPIAIEFSYDSAHESSTGAICTTTGEGGLCPLRATGGKARLKSVEQKLR